MRFVKLLNKFASQEERFAKLLNESVSKKELFPISAESIYVQHIIHNKQYYIKTHPAFAVAAKAPKPITTATPDLSLCDVI